MAIILTSDVLINNPDAPFITVYDPIESRTGSIFLWDAGKQKVATLPDFGTNLPNLLESYSPNPLAKFTYSKGNASDAIHNSYLKRELTSKGGLHLIASQARVDALTQNTFFGLSSNAALQTLLTDKIMGANPNLYVSVWSKVTRYVENQTGTASSPQIAYRQGGSAAAFYLESRFPEFQGGAVGTYVSKLAKTAKDSTIVGQANAHQANIKSIVGTGILDTTTFDIIAGTKLPWNGSANNSLNASPSWIVYRVYIEDLNLSGRTFEQVKAIDDAEFAKAFGVGGRFHGDTWSDPATVLP
ncbi:hypothetical protein ACX2CK_06565 [Acinetobacter schindleri]